MIEVVLYTKPECTLCEEAKAMLAGLQDRFPYLLTEVDITGSDALFERYRYRIPVFLIGEREVGAPIESYILEQALAAAITP